MRKRLFLIALGALPLLAQRPSFEAASVKSSEQKTGLILPGKTENPTRVIYRNYSLKRLIVEAFGLADFQLQGPAWLIMERFDVEAVKRAGVPAGQVRLMMQALLVERFHLVSHMENREMETYALLPGKNLSRMRRASEAEKASGCRSFGTLADYAGMLSRNLDRPVLDQTGLAGTYFLKFAVMVSPAGQHAEGTPPPAAPPPPVLPGCPGWTSSAMPAPASSAFEAVSEQMGLMLKRAGKGRYPVLVVDRIDRVPTAN